MVRRKEESMDNQNEKKPTLEEAFTQIETILTQMEEPEILRCISRGFCSLRIAEPFWMRWKKRCRSSVRMGK